MVAAIWMIQIFGLSPSILLVSLRTGTRQYKSTNRCGGAHLEALIPDRCCLFHRSGLGRAGAQCSHFYSDRRICGHGGLRARHDGDCLHSVRRNPRPETLTEGIIERMNLKEGSLEATFVALVGFGLPVFGALLIFSQIAGVIYGEPEVVGLMIVLIQTALLISVSGESTALLRRNIACRVLAIRSTASVIAGGLA